MQRLPSIGAVTHLLDTIEALHRRPRDRRLASPYPTLHTSITERLTAALRREHQHGTTTPDGYPANTLGTGMPSGKGAHSTPTEAVAASRARPPKDEHRELTLKAVRHLDAAVTHINALVTALNAIDELRGEEHQAEQCDACGPHREIITPIHARGDVGGRLDQPAKLCRPCYEFVFRGPGRLPTSDEVKHHERNGRWPRSANRETTGDLRL